MTAQPIYVGAGGPLGVSGSAEINAAGIAEVTLGPVPPAQVWLINRMTINVTSGARTTCSVYEGSVNGANLLDATSNGNQNISDFGAPYQLAPNEQLIFRWEGGTPGAVATARLLGRTQVA